MRKEKLRNVGLCFITGCFIKSFNMIINHFFISQAHSQPNFCFLIPGWRKKYQKEQLGTGIVGSRLAMNITQTKFSSLTKCAYMTLN